MFGKAFKTRAEAVKYLKETHGHEHYTVEKGYSGGLGVRLMKKKLFPKRTKRYHVGTYIDFLNFA